MRIVIGLTCLESTSSISMKCTHQHSAYLHTNSHTLRLTVARKTFFLGAGHHTMLCSDRSKPASQLAQLLYMLPILRQLLWSTSAAALNSCNTELRQLVHSFTKQLEVKAMPDLQEIAEGYWPQLKVVALHIECDSSQIKWRVSKSTETVACLELSQQAHNMYLFTYSTKIGQSSSTFLVRPVCQITSSCSRSQDDIAVTLNQPCWDNIGYLACIGVNLVSAQIRQLCARDWSHIMELDLNHISCDAAAVAILADAPWPKLKKLLISLRSMSYTSFKPVTQRQWPCLQQLGLRYVDVEKAGADGYIPNRASWPQLLKLCFDTITLHSTSMAQLASVHHTSLIVLSLTSGTVTARALDSLGQLPWLRLQQLLLQDMPIGPAEMDLLVQATMPELEYLSLVGTMLDTPAMQHLVNGWWPKLERLMLQENNIAKAGVDALARADWPSLYWVSMDTSVARVYNQEDMTLPPRLRRNYNKQLCVGRVVVEGPVEATYPAVCFRRIKSRYWYPMDWPRYF